MPSYETLDAIADAYNPALAIISLILIAVSVFRTQWKSAGLGLAGFALVALVAFGFMYIDRLLNIWPAFGLDYSTHTATALGLVLLLSLQLRKLTPVWLGSLFIYILLMLYQRYHTITDIVTTAIIVGLPLGWILSTLYRPVRDGQNTMTPIRDTSEG